MVTDNLDSITHAIIPHNASVLLIVLWAEAPPYTPRPLATQNQHHPYTNIHTASPPPSYTYFFFERCDVATQALLEVLSNDAKWHLEVSLVNTFKLIIIIGST